MKYLSTFSGIGGFEIGINKAYEQLQNNEYAPICSESEQEECTQRGEWTTDKRQVLLYDRDRTTPLCIGYSEINKYADQIYQSKFPEHKNYGDITKINEKELPDFDLFVGGFPCQAFSIAGKRGGFDDTRGTLFFDCARILKEKQPRNFILENVKGLLSHDNGRTFATIINTLTELGYCVEWQVLNAKNFGVPQNRERVFIVGHLGGIPERKVFPIGEDDQENTKSRQVCTSATVSTRTGSTAGGQQFIRNPYNGKQSEVETGTLGTSCGTTTGKTAQLLHKDTRIRRLTPLECERLMAYPDGWTEGLSDTQRYKTLGNGIVSNVVAEVVKRLYN
ncbi:MAG TPA: DNA (cytosine-5-)-methyltransferase [Candidatus Dojkabacteria bacterium]|nr:DNA (cytosine-5-)-methyltransferase [Candidatus Dojkabacteria bacterium]